MMHLAQSKNEVSSGYPAAPRGQTYTMNHGGEGMVKTGRDPPLQLHPRMGLPDF
jgi:hypothetical protein